MSALILENPIRRFLKHIFKYVLEFSFTFNKTLSKEETLESMEWVLQEYGDSILRLAYSYLHNKHDAEDVLQETLIKFMNCNKSFNDKEHMKAWLLRVAANISKNMIDYKNVRESEVLVDDIAGTLEEDLSFVWEAVKSLPDKYREVIHLFYQEGYKTSEISKILNRNESTVRSDLKRGKEKLKEILGEAYGF